MHYKHIACAIWNELIKKLVPNKLGIIFGDFWCDIMNIERNIKLVHDASKTTEKHTF
jgi:hypothetical protein